MSPVGLYAAYRVDIRPVEEAFGIVSEYVNNYNLIEPRAHVTLMYSKSVLPYYKMRPKVMAIIKPFPKLSATVTGIEIFDSPGTGKNTFSLVLSLECLDLIKIHQQLLDIGLAYGYSPYVPHLSLGYGLQHELANNLIDQCKPYTIGQVLSLKLPYVEPLNEQWGN